MDAASGTVGRTVTIMTDMNWTPVTDALPIKSGVYLVCNAHGTVFTAMYLGSHWGTDGVIAWMETPEPYKEDDNDTH